MATRAVFATLMLITLGITPLDAACPGGVSHFLTVKGQVNKPSCLYTQQTQRAVRPYASECHVFCSGGSCHGIIYRSSSLGFDEQPAGRRHRF
jgi:hypothetical protein